MHSGIISLCMMNLLFKWEVWVETFRYTEYTYMLPHDTCFNMSHVDYHGTIGQYYKAYVTIWAGPKDTGDTRYIWTAVEQTT